MNMNTAATKMFSLITVTYNAEKMVERTLKSVQGQTYKNIEYIIIDGASKDNTLSIIKKYQADIPNFSCISEPDKGLYDAMNKGLQRATGDYVWFLNAGDTLHSDTILEQIAQQLTDCYSSDKSLPNIIYGETDMVNEHGNFIARRRLKAPKRLNWQHFKMGMLVCHQSFIVRRNIAPLYDLQYRFSGDFDWCIRCMKSAGTIHNTQLILSDYLNEGMTTANRKASLKERFAIMIRYYGWLPTALRHIWFAVRFYTAKLFGRQV